MTTASTVSRTYRSGTVFFGNCVLTIFALLPTVWFAIWLGYLTRWKNHHGRWPDINVHNFTVPVEISGHEALTGIWLIFSLVTFPVWSLFVFYIIYSLNMSPIRIIVFIPWLVWLIYVIVDPYSYFWWYFD